MLIGDHQALAPAQVQIKLCPYVTCSLREFCWEFLLQVVPPDLSKSQCQMMVAKFAEWMDQHGLPPGEMP